jgi:hypothetical protein
MNGTNMKWLWMLWAAALAVGTGATVAHHRTARAEEPAEWAPCLPTDEREGCPRPPRTESGLARAREAAKPRLDWVRHEGLPVVWRVEHYGWKLSVLRSNDGRYTGYAVDPVSSNNIQVNNPEASADDAKRRVELHVAYKLKLAGKALE